MESLTYYTGCEVPENDRHGKSYDISYTPCKVEKQEDIPSKPANQRGRIEPNAPPWVSYRMLGGIGILAWIIRIVVIPPRCYQSSDGHDVRQWASGRCKKWYCGGGEPPILGLFIVVRPESELPQLLRVCGRTRQCLRLFDSIWLGWRRIGGVGFGAAHVFTVITLYISKT